MLSRWSGLLLVILALAALVIFQDTINGLFEDDKIVDKQGEVEVIQHTEPLATVRMDDALNSVDKYERDELETLLYEIPDESLVKPLEKPNVHGEWRVEEPASVSDGILGIGWVFQQSATNYTFQLMGSWERKEVEKFINQHALTGEVAVFESVRNGRVWCALIYGTFIDKETALKASNL